MNSDIEIESGEGTYRDSIDGKVDAIAHNKKRRLSINLDNSSQNPSSSHINFYHASKPKGTIMSDYPMTPTVDVTSMPSERQYAPSSSSTLKGSITSRPSQKTINTSIGQPASGKRTFHHKKAASITLTSNEKLQLVRKQPDLYSLISQE
jgi:hypothetical protein